MMDSARLLELEIHQLDVVAVQYRTNYEYWKLMYEAVRDERMQWNFWEYRRKIGGLKKTYKKNRKRYLQYQRQIKVLNREHAIAKGAYHE